MDKNTSIGATAGIGLVLVVAFVFASFSAQSDDTIFFIQKDNSTPEPCTGNVGLVLAQNITDLCDVEVTSPISTQLLEYNGTHWVNVNQSSATIVNSVTSNSNSTIGVVPTTGNVVLYPKYQLLCQTTLGSANATISCNGFTGMKNIRIETTLITDSSGTAIVSGIQFNGDTGTNYAWRRSQNVGADTTGTNTNQCQPRGAGSIPNGGGGVLTMDVNNISSVRKLLSGKSSFGLDTDDTTAPTHEDFACKWDNTSTQITTITIMKVSGTSNFNTNSQLTVWGYN